MELVFEGEDALSAVKTEPQDVGMVLLVFGETGVGKTTMFAQAPDVLIVQVKDTSADFLKKNRRMAADTPTITAKDWSHLLQILTQLARAKHPYKTILIDGMSGVEEYSNAYVLSDKFDGNITKFMAFGAGDRIAGVEFGHFVNLIQELRDQAKLKVIMLAHRENKAIDNPDGDNYTEFRPQINEKKLAPLTKYIDGTLMVDYLLTIKKADDKDDRGKVTGGAARIMITDGKASIRAKNRLGLPAKIMLGNSHQEAWQNFVTALQNASK